jgi:hypothetical protein
MHDHWMCQGVIKRRMCNTNEPPPYELLESQRFAGVPPSAVS